MNYKSRIFKPFFQLVFAFSWYSVHCSEYAKQNIQATSGLDEIGAKNGRISLAFVFDRTGSMYDDLVQVREGARRIFNSTIENGRSTVQNYILVPFRDPDVGPAFQTNDPAKFLKALNEIYVRGGKDCPEMSITAIKQALELSFPGSVIYVFTDAEAKDHRVLPDVIRLIKQKNIRVNFVLTGTCELDGNFTSDRKTYETIATLSSGQVVNLNKSEVNEIWKFVEVSINPRRKNIYSVDKFSQGEQTYVVEIDQYIEELIITVSGDEVEMNISDSMGEHVYPRDRGVEELLNLKSVVSVRVRNPKPGNWSITVRSHGRHTLRVEAISNRWEEVKGNHTVVVIPEVDECSRNLHDCSSDEECIDLPYKFSCVKKCLVGFEMTGEASCIDVNECTRHPGICRDRRCENTQGSYRCTKICPQGFQSRRDRCFDVDECSKYPNICGDKDCSNIRGSYRCLEKCSRGFAREDGNCKDIDECSQNPSICGNQICVNVPNSYRCERKCSRGFARDKNGSCKDINECSKYPTICGNRECINLKGSYRCKKCSRGFTRGQDGSCKDVNECTQYPTTCGSQECFNSQGSYRCEDKCPRGFTRDGNGDCIDVNECLVRPPRCRHLCENTEGGFQCLCLRGTRLANDGLTCLRINSCPAQGQGRCQYQCNSDTGKCECPSGYRLHWDNVSCIDINECLSGQQTCGTRTCFNTLGKYHCLNVSCPQGYHPTTDGYCTMPCFYETNTQCPAQYTKLQHTSISIPRYLPVNTDFLNLQPYIPPARSSFETLACYCATYFYPVQESNHLFGVYQIGQTGILYNRVVFDEPGFYQFHVVSDYLNGYGGTVSRTTFQVFVDVADHTF